MNKAKLKSYAPAARRDFIQAVTDRAHFYGLSEKEIVPVEVSGDVAIIGGRPFPRSVAAQRKKLEDRVKREGFNQVMEAVAYTWFNRFLALRYMELHGYLEHGFRVLSNTGSSTVPEILDHAAQLELPGPNKQMVVELKLDGSKDAELYRLLLVAQCNALHAAMPFLFEKIEDETELLLPDNLLHSDSLIRKLVTEIDEEDWQEVEIIGWLYQFYISEKKEQVIGKVVKSEDIPAATQLFTPNWVVKYMVQNSLGRKWLATYPNSPLKSKMEYYIEPAEQTNEVNAQLAEITPDSLNPEKLTLLDPASGSGHILVEAYDVFKEIYAERGYTNRDYPRLILEKNLYGLDIDDRAAQMTGFALLMKARKDDRRILRSENPVKLNVHAVQESANISIDNSHWGEHANTLKDIVDLFKHGKTFGSLIQVPKALAEKISVIEEVVNRVIASVDMFAVQTALELLPLLEQAKVLAGEYDCVVANPPYMGSGFMCPHLKSFVDANYFEEKGDLFCCFLRQGANLSKVNNGSIAFVTMQSWMYLSNYEAFRRQYLKDTTINCLAHLGNGVMGIAFSTCATVFYKCLINDYVSAFIKVDSADVQNETTVDIINTLRFNRTLSNFSPVPSLSLAYSLEKSQIELFNLHPPISDTVEAREGMSTADNNRFLRYWWEVSQSQIMRTAEQGLDTSNLIHRWFPYQKGGEAKKWYGNNEWIVDWKDDGYGIRTNIDTQTNRIRSHNYNGSYSFRSGITWSAFSNGGLTFRYVPKGYLFDSTGSMAFTRKDIYAYLALLNCSATFKFLKSYSPSPRVKIESLLALPDVIDDETATKINEIGKTCVQLAQNIDRYYETSPDFRLNITQEISFNVIVAADMLDSIKKLAQNEVTIEHIISSKFGFNENVELDFQENKSFFDIKNLLSFIFGCMMGRYSLDQPGLVYANSGNVGFDTAQYQIFPADDDGIVPVMDMDWFPDDAASRFEEFLKVVWTPEKLEENLKYVADSLSPKAGETPRETIRRYISSQFFKDHLQTYKKRPIYWLFSSGKQRAFECLVYLHRYNESTLSRMRNEYVNPLQGKFSAQADYLASEVNAATSTAERNRLQKQLDTLRKKQVELAAFDDLLRHYADQRISLDLDEGVKVNYGKFGALLAEVKAVTGGGE